jgi:hypothetical protein
VAAIMGILAGVAAVSLRGLRSPALASAANEVASAMKSARQMAIASGRKTYLAVPIAANAYTTNLFRSYAIFEEVPRGEPSRNPPYATNEPPLVNAGNSEVVCEALTDWRTLPDGVVFCNLAAGSYSAQMGDPMPTNELGQLLGRTAGQANGREEWRYFESFTNLAVRTPGTLAQLNDPIRNASFLGFYPSGRGCYNSPGYGQGAGFRLAVGFVRGDQVAITDNKNYYTVETDAFTGRVRVRARESFQQ